MKAILILCVPLLVVALGVGFGLRRVGATRLWPAGLLIGTAPLEAYRSSSGAGGNVSVFRLALAVAGIAWLFDLARRRVRFPQRVAAPFAIYSVLVLWQVASFAFVTSNHSLAYRFLAQYVIGLSAAFLITTYVRPRDLRTVAGLAAGAAVLPLIAGAYRVFSVINGGSGDLPGLSELPINLTIEGARQTASTLLDGTQRLNSTFADPNQYGFYIATALLLTCGLTFATLFAARRVRPPAAAACGLLAVACGLSVVGTYSRSSWVLAAVGVVLFAVLLGRTFWTRRRLTWAAALLATCLALASPAIVTRLGSAESGNAKSTQVHEHTMKLAVKLAIHHPLVGVGLGGYGKYANEPPLISSSVSTYLTTAAELGLIGLALLLAAIIVTCVGAIRSVMEAGTGDRAALAGVVAAYVALAAANTIGEVWMNDFQWVLFGIVLALTRQAGVGIMRPGSRNRKRTTETAGPAPAQTAA